MTADRVTPLIGADNPAVLVSARVCSQLSPVLRRAEKDSRRNGIRLDADLTRTLQAIHECAQAHWDLAREARTERQARSASGTCGTPLNVDIATMGLMTTSEVAFRLGIGPRTVRALAQRGTLPARRSGRAWAFDPTDVVAYEERRKESAA